MKQGYRILIGIAAAALAGVGIGMLIAPDSGKRTREKLRDGSDKIAKKIQKITQDTTSSIEEFAQEVIDKAKVAIDQAKGFVKAEGNSEKEKVDKVS